MNDSAKMIYHSEASLPVGWERGRTGRLKNLKARAKRDSSPSQAQGQNDIKKMLIK
jgi:hypothetical protein